MSLKNHAVGLLVKDRWEFTEQTLFSLRFCDHSAAEYDLFVIDNGSDISNFRKLKDWLAKYQLPVKNLFALGTTVSMAKAWNLFLYVSQGYRFRTKIDNDIILAGTKTPLTHKMAAMAKKKMAEMQEQLKEAGGTNPGAIPGRPVLGQAVSKSVKRGKRNRTTKFLGLMQDFGSHSNADLVSLVPISDNTPFGVAYQQVMSARFSGHPFLDGRCMMITKRAFDTCGYFDEKLPRLLEIDYCYRAMVAGLNICYHPQYWIRHIGNEAPTEGITEAQIKVNKAQQRLVQFPATKVQLRSSWQECQVDIRDVAAESKVVRLN